MGQTTFLSARPVRAATRCRLAAGFIPPRFYPRDPCGPRLPDGHRLRSGERVSIRATRAGRDAAWLELVMGQTVFLSARPVRAATTERELCLAGLECFYPRDPCGPRHEWQYQDKNVEGVSIRATRAGRDVRLGVVVLVAIVVSIRATRAGRDSGSFSCRGWPGCFYPRDPCGPRHEEFERLFEVAPVSIRATRAGRDEDLLRHRASAPVSIRATRAGRDCPAGTVGQWYLSGFYPRDPCGPRLCSTASSAMRVMFLSARPVRAATCHA